jgi:Leu/Phe-tRNA-protein transferase
MIAIFSAQDYHALCDMQRKLHNREWSMSFDEQRDFAESMRILLARAEPVDEQAWIRREPALPKRTIIP